MNLETNNKNQEKGIMLVISNPCGNIKETKMKNSGIEWIGEIPDEWEVSKIGQLYEERKTKVSDTVYPPLSVTMQGILPQLETAAKSDAHDDRKLVLKGDFVINSRSDRRGSCGISEFNGSVSLINTVLHPKNEMNPIYYNWLFHSFRFSDEYYKNGHGIVDDLWTTSWTEMKKIFIPLPPKEIQQRIASYLDKKCNKIEETIQNQQQVIEKLKAYKQSLITEAVTGKVKIENGKACGEYESYKDSGVEWIGKIPSEWEVKKLKFSSQIMRGLFSHRPRNDPDYYDGVHPFIQTGEVARAVKYITTYSQTLNELGFSVSREFPAGTVLLTIAANVGDVAILDFNACFPDSVIGFYPKENVSKIFMFYVLKSMKEQFMRNAIISTQMNLNINIVKEEFIPLPSLAEQKEIVKFLEKKSDYIDTAIEQKQSLIEKLTEYKKSLIYECVTGKKEI